MSDFRNSFGESIFRHKYALTPTQTWAEKVDDLMHDVCTGILTPEDSEYLGNAMKQFKFMAGGRYIYYAGRQASFYNNCYLLKGEEDTREEWGKLTQRVDVALSTPH